MNNTNTHNFSLYSAICGATLENLLRQPLTAVTVVMINQNISMKEATSHLYQQGGIKRFYNGLQGFNISWAMRTTHRISTFGLNEKMCKEGFSYASIAVATTVAEFVTTAFGELVLTISQNSSSKTKSPISLIQERYTKEGLKALTNGFLGNSLRNIIFNGSLFGLKNHYSNKVKEHPFISSALISFIAVNLSHPAEVIRIQKVSSNSTDSYASTAIKIFKQSSYKGFFKGLLPRIYSVGVGTFVMMTVYTKIKNK